MFFKIVICFALPWKWSENRQIKEATHMLTNIAIFVMIFILNIPILAIEAPSSASHLVTFIVVAFISDAVALLVNFLVIWYVGRKARAVFETPELWNRFVSEYARKVLSYFPIGDYMQNEMTQAEEEERMRLEQEEAMKEKEAMEHEHLNDEDDEDY
jgi:hypothetical protein